MEAKERISALAEMMQEYRLAEARLQMDGLTIGFRRRATVTVTASPVATSIEVDSHDVSVETVPQAIPEAPKGTPVTSPMTGIYYGASSPSSPPFVKEGDSVTAGQVIGLIEAMKVFNEVPCPVSGTVLEIVSSSGDLVNPGDVLIRVG